MCKHIMVFWGVTLHNVIKGDDECSTEKCCLLEQCQSEYSANVVCYRQVITEVLGRWHREIMRPRLIPPILTL